MLCDEVFCTNAAYEWVLWSVDFVWAGLVMQITHTFEGRLKELTGFC